VLLSKLDAREVEAEDEQCRCKANARGEDMSTAKAVRARRGWELFKHSVLGRREHNKSGQTQAQQEWWPSSAPGTADAQTAGEVAQLERSTPASAAVDVEAGKTCKVMSLLTQQSTRVLAQVPRTKDQSNQQLRRVLDHSILHDSLTR